MASFLWEIMLDKVFFSSWQIWTYIRFKHDSLANVLDVSCKSSSCQLPFWPYTWRSCRNLLECCVNTNQINKASPEWIKQDRFPYWTVILFESTNKDVQVHCQKKNAGSRTKRCAIYTTQTLSRNAVLSCSQQAGFENHQKHLDQASSSPIISQLMNAFCENCNKHNTLWEKP